ncbi:MAG: PSD1 and planctomycete cytochrome C domain-containing protein [Planctomycetota bacterium]|jgi:mono/diheme cytochrome c family protein
MQTTPFLLITTALLVTAFRSSDAAADPSFARDIRPILASRCFVCHGPDESHREGDLRLDQREDAIDAGALVPGNSSDSELIRRILTTNPDEQMPPPDAKDQLTEKQKSLLRDWVQSGGEYEPHWAFVKPVRHEPPASRFDAQARNAIDRFIFARLESEGFAPSAQADRYALIRRVSLDLIGIPPTPEEADEFVADTDPRAYENLVDRLLESPRYGERWARVWLDLARYSDTNGYEKDRPRSIWPYRDWVIKALNADMPLDRFTIEQLAGDMLPNATLDQRIATGFHRNTMLNEEGGIDPLEYRFYAMVDRVATTGTIWLGLTTGCAQCHTHKYDPLLQTEYYGLMALLNNADEPDLLIPDPAAVNQREQLLARIEKLENELASAFPPLPENNKANSRTTDTELRQQNFDQSFGRWLDQQRQAAVAWSVQRPTTLQSNLPRLEVLDDGSIFSTGDITKRDVLTLTFDITAEQLPVTAMRLEALPDDRLPAGGPGRAFYEGRKGDFFLSEFTATLDDEAIAFSGGSQSFGKIGIGSGDAKTENVFDGDGSTGWSTAGREGDAHQIVLNLTEPVTTAGKLTIELLFERHFAASLGRFRISTTSDAGTPAATQLPVELETTLAAGGEPDDATTAALRRQYVRVAPELAEARKPIDALRRRIPNLPHTMIMHERPDDNMRPTFRHHRGEYLSPRERVEPTIPAVFKDGGPEPTNRLEFARWLVSDHNPLAARVAVNRAWQAFFGTGLVATADDFGTQANPPTHPNLLDWLATEFAANAWSQKKLHRLIVTSATYRQQSTVTPELLERDPGNELLARGPRFRVPAETVRDIMLTASGLLSEKMFGPSVYPPQPASVTGLAYGGFRWNASAGEDRYRRSLYTFSKRTAPFAAYTVFDAPTGEGCVARRNRSNIPLQALTLLNDGMFLEMARALASDVIDRNAATTDALDTTHVATQIFRRLLTRPPAESELAAICDYHQAQFERIRVGDLNPWQILGEPQAARPASPQPPPLPEASDSPVALRVSNKSAAESWHRMQRAAWVMVARALMNLDETITHP